MFVVSRCIAWRKGTKHPIDQKLGIFGIWAITKLYSNTLALLLPATYSFFNENFNFFFDDVNIFVSRTISRKQMVKRELL